MKYIEVYDNKKIYISENDNINEFSYSTILKADVIIRPVRKEKKGEIGNALANFLSSSISNGNEKMRVGLTLSLNNDEKEDVFFVDVVQRYSDKYNEYIEQARYIQKKIATSKK